MTIQLDRSQPDRVLERQARLLSAKELARAGAAALNRAGRAARTAMGRGIRAELALKASTVRDGITISRATPGKLEVDLKVDRRPIPLQEFGGAAKVRQTREGVAVRIKKGAPRTVIKSAFLVDQYGGHVFSRRGPERGPLKMRMGPSIASQSAEAWPDAERRAAEVLTVRLDHEVTRRFSKANR
jgi:hypothetical protein